MAALTTEAIWIQDTWQLRRVLLHNLEGIESCPGKQLILVCRPETSAEKMTLTFASLPERERWAKEIETRRQEIQTSLPVNTAYLPEGVALVKRMPDTAYVVVDRVGFTAQTPWAADRGVQLRAGMRGADAVIDLERRKCPELGWGGRHVSGAAVRIDNAGARQRVRLRWYAEETSSLGQRMLLLLLIQATALFLLAVLRAGPARLHMPTGETLPQTLADAGMGMAIIFAWPLLLLAFLWLLRWSQLVRLAGLAVLAATTGRGLTVWLAHVLAVQTSGAALSDSNLWILLDPVDWAFIIMGIVLCVRAWRLAGDAQRIVPQELQVASTARRAWARGLLGVTGVYVLGILAFVATARYQASAYLLEPGVDPQREHQALQALNEGAALANNGALDAADKSLQRSLHLWEELTRRGKAPAEYRANLATSLNDLGWIRQRQGREEEAEKYYARAVALADELLSDSFVDDEFKKTMAGARAALAQLRGGKSFAALDDKDRAAERKFEEAQVKADKGKVEAEALYREAIALWEDIFPHATNQQYRKRALACLAGAYQQLAEFQRQLGKRAEAEASLKKGIDYGERAVAADPDRPLPRHNLEIAQRMLEGLRDQALQEELDRLQGAQRYADAVELCLRNIDEQEDRLRAGKDRDAAERRLAYRLDRFAWFLAHCPDGRVRDTRLAVKRAQRATELQPDVGDYWYTLAMVQYRNGDWRDSLASLEKVKLQAGGFDAMDWLLAALNRHQLKQRDEARAALRKAAEWMEEQQRQAEGNALLRFRLEMVRPTIESLRREAEDLIEGKGSSGDRIG